MIDFLANPISIKLMPITITTVMSGTQCMEVGILRVSCRDRFLHGLTGYWAGQDFLYCMASANMEVVDGIYPGAHGQASWAQPLMCTIMHAYLIMQNSKKGYTLGMVQS